jgi:MFS family permease
MNVSFRTAGPVAYGFSLTFASSVGQTFLLSLFVPSLLLATRLTPGELASLYSAATLAAALLLPVVGRRIDRVDILRFGLGVGAGTAGGCLLLAISSGPLPVFIALAILRLFGQGLLPHTGMTGAARAESANRGTAIGLICLGYTAGEAILPLLAAASIDGLGWRWTYAILGFAVGGLIVPAATLAIWRDKKFRFVKAPRIAAESSSGRDAGQSVFRSLRFWCYLPALCFPSLAMTALLFLQTFIAAEKGVATVDFAAGFILYAVIQIPASLLFGLAVDKLGSGKALLLHILPLAGGAAILAFGTNLFAVWSFLALAGVTAAASSILRTTFVAEIVPGSALGSARSSVASLTTIAAAAGPAIYGWALELGMLIDHMLWLTAGLAVATLLPALGFEITNRRGA